MAGSQSKQKTIEKDLIRIIEKGEIPPLAKLPSGRELSKKYNVSASTMFQVFKNLANMGYITTVTGEGVYATDRTTVKRKRIRTNCISLIVPNMKSSYISEMVRGIESVISRKNYYLSIFNSTDDYALERESLEKALELNSKAILLFPVTLAHATCPNYDIYLTVQKEDIPLVFLDNYPLNLNVDYVVANNYKGLYDLTKYVIKMGHRKIAFIGGPHHKTNVGDRFRGFWGAMKQAGLKVNTDFTYPNQDTPLENYNLTVADFVAQGAEYLKSLLKSNSSVSAVIFSILFRCHLDVFKALHVNIPVDLSICCVGPTELENEHPYEYFGAGKGHVDITRALLPGYSVGSKAAEVAIERIEGKISPVPVKMEIDMPVYIGNSVKLMGKKERHKKKLAEKT